MLVGELFSEENRVIVRIWTSSHHHSHPGEDVGHISLEVPQVEGESLYISLWPQRAADNVRLEDTKATPGFFRAEPGTLIQSAQDDIRLEGRRPELMYCLYTFDVDAIAHHFAEKKANLGGWVLFGGNWLASDSESCATLASSMLRAGDTQHIFGAGSIGSVTSPDGLSTALQATRIEEARLFEERGVQRPVCEGETPLHQHVEKCILM